jgi:hypothetical protein
VTIDWNPDDPDATRVHYDLSRWSFDQQAELASDLAEAEIPHAWDGPELMVPDEFEAAADAAIAIVEERLGITDGAGRSATATSSPSRSSWARTRSPPSTTSTSGTRTSAPPSDRC